MKVFRQIAGLGSAEELMRVLEEAGSISRAAERLGCSRQTVSKAMKKYGVPKKGYVLRNKEMKEKLRLL